MLQLKYFCDRNELFERHVYCANQFRNVKVNMEKFKLKTQKKMVKTKQHFHIDKSNNIWISFSSSGNHLN